MVHFAQSVAPAPLSAAAKGKGREQHLFRPSSILHPDNPARSFSPFVKVNDSPAPRSYTPPLPPLIESKKETPFFLLPPLRDYSASSATKAHLLPPLHDPNALPVTEKEKRMLFVRGLTSGLSESDWVTLWKMEKLVESVSPV